MADVLPGFLGKALPFTDEFVAHDPHLRALLQSYAPGLGTLTDVIRNGELRLALIPDLDARCRRSDARHEVTARGTSYATTPMGGSVRMTSCASVRSRSRSAAREATARCPS